MAHTPRRTDPAIRARVAELHAQGLTRNAIARDLGIAQSTVTLIAGDLGLSFDRARTAEATRAKVADARQARAELVLRFYGQAHAALDRLDRTEHDRAEVSAGQLVQWTAADLPAQDIKALVQAAGSAADRAVRLEQVDADTMNLPAVDAWLRSMTGTADEPDTGG